MPTLHCTHPGCPHTTRVYAALPQAFPGTSWTFPKLPDMLLYPTDIRRFGMLDALTTGIREFLNKWCAPRGRGSSGMLPCPQPQRQGVHWLSRARAEPSCHPPGSPESWQPSSDAACVEQLPTPHLTTHCWS